jgi:hypothetical protein
MKGSKVYYRILTLAIIAFWLTMVGLLVKRAYFKSEGLSSGPILTDMDKTAPTLGEEWMGIYMGKDKIGYSVTNIQKEGNIFLVSEKALIKLNVMGTPQNINIHTNSALDEDFSLKSFDFSLRSGMVEFQANGEVTADKIDININTGGREIKKKIPISTTPYLPGSLRFMLIQQELSVGKEFKVPFFDPSTMSNDEITIQVEAKERIVINGSESLSYRLKESFKGVVLRAWVDEQGTLLKEEGPLGIVLVRETKEDALAKNYSTGLGIDIISSTSVPVTGHIDNPQSIQYLKIRFEGVSLSDFNMDDERQVLKGDIIEITKEEIDSENTYLIPLKEKGFKDYLVPSALVQSNDPEIIEEANRIVKDEKNAVNAAKIIMEWVYHNIDKRPTISIPSALEVLDLKSGDCNEHTVLFAALTKAVGIPTKIITGIVFSEERFYYHSWAKVFVGRWISIDPTMKQFPTDATHVEFVEGGLDRQIEMLKVIGHLKAEILGYK